MPSPDQHKPSLCDRCGGVFSDAVDSYFKKPDAPCKSCGAQPHWERCGASNQELRPGETPVYRVPKRPGPPIRDLDSELLSAEWLLVARFNERVDVFGAANADRIDRNYGSRKTAHGWRRNDRPDETDETVLLPGVEKAGTTGNPVGKPAKGIRDEDRLIGAINATLFEDPRTPTEHGIRVHEVVHAANARADAAGRAAWYPSDLKAVRMALLAEIPPEALNTATVAEHYGLSRRSARRLVLSPNSPKGGDNSMTLEMIDTRLARIERLESMRSETMDRIRLTVERLSDHLMADERVRSAGEEFLSDASERDAA